MLVIFGRSVAAGAALAEGAALGLAEADAAAPVLGGSSHATAKVAVASAQARRRERHMAAEHSRNGCAAGGATGG
jgi:hypothetical protein